MNNMFVFSMHTETKFYDKGDIIFSDKGDTLGKVIRCSETEILEGKIFYSYDIESTEDDYRSLKNGKVKIWKLEKYSVFPCSTFYYRG